MNRMNRWVSRALVVALGVDLFSAGLQLSRGRIGWALLNVATGLFVLWSWRRLRRSHAAVRAVHAQATALMVAAAEAAPRPEGVRIVRADGTEVPVELVYLGVQEDHHEWLVAGAVLNAGDRLTADVMPGHTGLIFESGDGTGGWRMRP